METNLEIANKQYPEYLIQMYSSKSNIFKTSFDSKTGKGTGNMTNWYLCNGLNGTPNLNNNTQSIKYIIHVSREPINGLFKLNHLFRIINKINLLKILKYGILIM